MSGFVFFTEQFSSLFNKVGIDHNYLIPLHSTTTPLILLQYFILQLLMLATAGWAIIQ